MTTTNVLTTARAAALFASDLSVHDQPTPPQVSAAIQRSVRALGGTRVSAGAVAAAYGDCPETAAVRMRWALNVVKRTYTRPAPRPCTLGPTSEPPTRRSPGSDPSGPHAQKQADPQDPRAAMLAVETISVAMS